MYLWVHLRAEEGEQDDFVPPSELVPLPSGHLEHLIPNHHPLDENGGREAEGLAQDTVCNKGGTAELTVSVWVRSPALWGVICRGTDVYRDQLMKKSQVKVRRKWALSPVQGSAEFHILVSNHKELVWPASRGYVPNTGVWYNSSELLVRCWLDVSWRLKRLISDLSASMASGWASRKARSQKAAGPLLHWKKKKRKKNTQQ